MRFLILFLVILMAGCERQSSHEALFQKGLFDLYIDDQDQTLKLKIPASEDNYIYYTSLARGLGSNDIGADRGLLGDTKIVSFERAGDKILLREHNLKYRASSVNPVENNAVAHAFPDFILWSFPLLESNNSHWTVDATSFAMQDSINLQGWLNSMEQGDYVPSTERSQIFTPRTKTFPQNTEIEAVITFIGNQAGPYLNAVIPNDQGFSVHIHHSFLQLPEPGFEPLSYNPQSGYFSVEWQDYTKPLDEDLTIRVIPRHRLEKKTPEAAVSYAVEPIVYYLDPGVPEPIRSALLEGGRWWNHAFEAIGYKEAFQVRLLPDDADPMDARYNVINWVHRATRGWSYGASITDPRTGEIIKGHVTLGSLRVRQDLAIAQALLNDSQSEEAKVMALSRIRQLSAHEIGHTLGIAHNFAASESNRSSVMDYPHPLISLTEGQISLNDAYATGIGEWDKLVIAYGYGDQPEEALAKLNETSIGYVSDAYARPAGAAISIGHLWDNGNDPVNELNRLMTIRSQAISKLSNNALRAEDPSARIDLLLVPIYNLHRFQIEAVARQIGGVKYQSKLNQMSSPVSLISVTNQRLALKSFIAALSTDALVLSNALTNRLLPYAKGYYRTRESSPTQMGEIADNFAMAEAFIRHALSKLLASERLNRLATPGHLSIDELTDTLIKGLVNVSPDRSVYGLIEHRRALILLDELGNALQASTLSLEAKTQLWGAINQQLDLWPTANSPEEKRIRHALESISIWPSQSEKQTIPPGSPI